MIAVPGAFSAFTKFVSVVEAVPVVFKYPAAPMVERKVNTTPAIVTVSPLDGSTEMVSVADYGRLFE